MLASKVMGTKKSVARTLWADRVPGQGIVESGRG